MTQQKSEGRVVPEGQGNLAPTVGARRLRGGKAVPVEQQVMQLELPFVTAENPQGAAREAPSDLSGGAEARVPKAKGKGETSTPVTMDEIALGVSRKTAWRPVYDGRKSIWALTHDAAVDRGLRNAYFAERGLVSLVALHRETHSTMVAPTQLALGPG